MVAAQVAVGYADPEAAKRDGRAIGVGAAAFTTSIDGAAASSIYRHRPVYSSFSENYANNNNDDGDNAAAANAAENANGNDDGDNAAAANAAETTTNNDNDHGDDAAAANAAEDATGKDNDDDDYAVASNAAEATISSSAVEVVCAATSNSNIRNAAAAIGCRGGHWR